MNTEKSYDRTGAFAHMFFTKSYKVKVISFKDL